MKPLLAATVEDISTLKYPLLASPKLDGIRALVIDGQILSRKLKPIPNHHVQNLFNNPSLNGLDGELIVGDPWHPEAFRRTTSGVMSHLGEPEVVFHVFDNFLSPEGFGRRWQELAKRTTFLIRRVPHQVVSNPTELTALEEECLARGYEGVMLRDPHGVYKYGRSTLKEHILLKLKRFSDDFATIIGVEEQMRNDNEQTRDALGKAKRSNHQSGMVGKNTLGALRVRGLTGPYEGVEFSVGSGMDDLLRQQFWDNPPIGKTLKVKYFPSGSKDAPRFPVFISLVTPDEVTP